MVAIAGHFMYNYGLSQSFRVIFSPPSSSLLLSFMSFIHFLSLSLMPFLNFTALPVSVSERTPSHKTKPIVAATLSESFDNDILDRSLPAGPTPLDALLDYAEDSTG